MKLLYSIRIKTSYLLLSWSRFIFDFIPWIRCSAGFRKGLYATIHIIQIPKFFINFWTISLLWILQLSHITQILLLFDPSDCSFLFITPFRNKMNRSLFIVPLNPTSPSQRVLLYPTIKLILNAWGSMNFQPEIPFLHHPYLLVVFLFTLNSSTHKMIIVLLEPV